MIFKLAVLKKEKKESSTHIKRVDAGARILTPWLFEPAKLADDRADYCLDCNFLPGTKLASTRNWFSHLSGLGRALWAKNGEGSAQ